ncbi:hypothetical protein GH714_020302 [Hevea brasiliensis]|uniref:Serine-threonine/tyrosine-protein kinase catalytic domain-containing protein n=1 Tax=Hevea brasiliensis TaxID=3981 RepID=A0A6A6LT10_HEVBR|nr:hypothetical protein GH714_020302 [Hevea brasiliensis]
MCWFCEAMDEIRLFESLQFDLGIIRIAKDDFLMCTSLGKGDLELSTRLFNGQDIAVKRLSRDSRQGNSEFENGILLVAKLQHRNLDILFCLEGNEMLLTYDSVPIFGMDADCFRYILVWM